MIYKKLELRNVNNEVLFELKSFDINLFSNPNKELTGIYTVYADNEPYKYSPDNLQEHFRVFSLLASYPNKINVVGKIVNNNYLNFYDKVITLNDNSKLCLYFSDVKIKDLVDHVIMITE